MGDFNESQKKKGPILKYLEGTKNLINIATTRNLNNNPTWKSGKNTSTIDYIWTTPAVASTTSDFRIQDPEDWFDTDYQALTTKMEAIKTKKQSKTRRKYRKVFNLGQATNKTWTDWKKSI